MRTFVLVAVSGLAASCAMAQNAALERERAYAAQLMADAAARSSLADDAGVSGFRDGRFYISDGTGANSLGISGAIQFRYNAAFRSDDPPLTSDQNFTHGFSLPLTRLRGNGSIWSRDLEYALSATFANSGGFRLEDAYLSYNYENGVAISVGQFKIPLLREENVSEENQLVLEHSQTNEYFNQDWSQGVMIAYRTQQARVFGTVSDGFASPFQFTTANTDFNSALEADIALSLRGEWMWAGADWSRFDRFSSWRSTSTYAGMLGAAVAWQTFGSTGALAQVNDGTDFTYTIDATAQGSGWSAMLAFVGNHNDTDGVPATDDLGFVLQGGYFVSDQAELYGRWNTILLDDNSVLAPGADDALHFITVGVNYFLFRESDAAKFSADFVFALNETNGLVDPTNGDTRTGLLGDSSSGEVDLRLQLQVKF